MSWVQKHDCRVTTRSTVEPARHDRLPSPDSPSIAMSFDTVDTVMLSLSSLLFALQRLRIPVYSVEDGLINEW
jgi:hypothetical protein